MGLHFVDEGCMGQRFFTGRMPAFSPINKMGRKVRCLAAGVNVLILRE